MSIASKVTFGLCCLSSIGIATYVHYRQEFDRKQLHLGVVRDNELQERRRIQNLYYLEQQNEITKQLRLTEKRERDQRASA